MAYEQTHEGYLFSDDPAKLDPAAIKAYLKRSYWAAKRDESVIEESLKNSFCLGLYDSTGAQVGLFRLITDYATYGWLCDVYVLEEHRGKGLSKAGLTALYAHPRLQTIARFMLGTKDAHSLYTQFGFTPIQNPERMMEKRTAHFSLNLR